MVTPTGARAADGIVGRLGSLALPPCPTVVPLAALWAIVAALSVDVVALTLDLIRLRRLGNGATEATVGLDISSTLSMAANLVVPLAMLVAAAAFGWWFADAYRRLAATGPTRHAPGWAIAGWFVPGLNLIRPPSIMAELASTGQRSAVDRSGDLLVAGWWLLLIEGMVIQVVLRFVTPTTNAGWTKWQGSALVSDVVLMAAAGCAIALVVLVDRQLGSGGSGSSPGSPGSPRESSAEAAAAIPAS